MAHRTRAATKASSDVRFWFLLVDQNFTSASHPKDVNVPSDGVVEDFQKTVIALGWKQFKNVAHTDLIVWKLPTPQPPREARKPTYLASIKAKGEILEEGVEMKEEMVGKGKGKAKEKAKQEVKTASQLFPGDKISSYLMEPTSPYNIRVLVQVAAGAEAPQDEYPSKRRRLASCVDHSWLEEVHSKIWNNITREPELFRGVEVTQAHYTILQKRLQEKNPDRDSLEYHAFDHDVESIKLGVLGPTFPAEAVSPRHPDNNEDRAGDDEDPGPSNEDISDIKSFFPFTLRFLDLSALDLKEELPDRFPSPLYLRQEYDDISELIKKEPKKGSVIVSGQPGTGKTAYLYLMVIRSMIEGRPFLYQTMDKTVYHVHEKGVQAIESWSSKKDIVAFVDGDKDNYEPHDMLKARRSVRIVLASSPKGANQPWMKDKGSITALATKLWSARELFLTGIFLYPYDISFELLRESTWYFGYNPRRCFRAAHSVRTLEKKKEEVRSQIRNVAGRESNISQLLHSFRVGD